MKRKFPFNKTGVKFYEKVVFNETMQALDNGTIDNYEIQIKIGENTISVPMYAEAYENIIEFLNNTLEDLNA